MSWNAGGDVVRPVAAGGGGGERPRLHVRAKPTSPTPRRAVRVTRLVLAVIAVPVAILLGVGFGAHRGSSVAPAAPPSVAGGLGRLPLAARGPISRLLGARDDAFAVHRMRASNPAQHFEVGFAAGGVSIAAGAARLSMTAVAYGRPGAMQTLGSARAHAHGNEVRYSYGSLSESFANGPLGLEQSFEVASPPHSGSGSLAIRLRLGGGLSARMRHGALLLAGHGAKLRYGDLVVTDATGRRLPASLALARGGVAIRLDARGATYPLHVDPLVRDALLEQPGESSDGGFGFSVAISGRTIAVGDPYTEESKGVVYVFEEPEAGWASTDEPVATLNGSGTKTYFGEGFGSSVALSGTTLVVGAPSFAAATYDYGLAYVFEAPNATGWKAASEVARLEGVPKEEIEQDAFGAQVAIAGKTIAVSAPFRSDNVGAVFVFREPAKGWSGTPSYGALLHGPPFNEGQGCPQFGDGLALAEYESKVTVAVGAPGVYGSQSCEHHLAGHVYVFTAAAGGWTEGKEYEANTTLSSGATAEGDGFGASVAISEEGADILAGAPGQKIAGAPNAGAAFLFTRPSGGWVASPTPVTLTSPDPFEGAGFGSSVAIAGNAARALVEQEALEHDAEHPTAAEFQWGRDFVFERSVGGWASSDAPAEELVGGEAEELNLVGEKVALEGETVLTGAGGPGGPFIAIFAPSALNVEISSPANGAEYTLGQTVTAAYKCVPPPDTEITECNGPVANGAQIDTSSEGNYSFTVTAKDSAGASFSRTSYFRVSASASTQKPGKEPVSKEGAQQTKTQAQTEAEEAAHRAQVKQELKEFAAYVAYILEHPAPLGLCFNEGGFQENGSVVPVAGWISAHGTTAPTGVSSAGAAVASIASAGKHHKKKPKTIAVFATRVHVEAGKVSFKVPFTKTGRKLAKEDIAKHRSLKVKWTLTIEPAGLPKITKTFTVTLKAGPAKKQKKKKR